MRTAQKGPESGAGCRGIQNGRLVPFGGTVHAIGHGGSRPGARSGRAVAIVLLAIAGPAAAEEVSPLSPGEADVFVAVEGRCPTFSWTPAIGADGHEVSVFRFSPELAAGKAGVENAELVWTRRLPGSASSWTPAAEDCFQPGGRYGWSVRAVGEDGSGDWSELVLFRAAPVPAAAEVRRAVEVLQRYEESRSGGSNRLGVQPDGGPGESSSKATGVAPGRGSGTSGATGRGPGAAKAEVSGLSLRSDGTVVGNAFLFTCGQGATSLFYRDDDGDDLGVTDDSVQACQAPAGFVSSSGDCDDTSFNCDPFNPEPTCGSDARCIPTEDGTGTCEAGTGAGTQGALCFTNSDCATEYVCVSDQCTQLCRVGGSDCSLEICTSFDTPLYVCSTEYGVCL